MCAVYPASSVINFCLFKEFLFVLVSILKFSIFFFLSFLFYFILIQLFEITNVYCAYLYKYIYSAVTKDLCAHGLCNAMNLCLFLYLFNFFFLSNFFSFSHSSFIFFVNEKKNVLVLASNYKRGMEMCSSLYWCDENCLFHSVLQRKMKKCDFATLCWWMKYRVNCRAILCWHSFSCRTYFTQITVSSTFFSKFHTKSFTSPKDSHIFDPKETHCPVFTLCILSTHTNIFSHISSLCIDTRFKTRS